MAGPWMVADLGSRPPHTRRPARATHTPVGRLRTPKVHFAPRRRGAKTPYGTRSGARERSGGDVHQARERSGRDVHQAHDARAARLAPFRAPPTAIVHQGKVRQGPGSKI